MGRAGLIQALAAMGRFKLFVAVSLGVSAGYATAGSVDYVYFPKLAQGMLAGDSNAFRQVLAQASVTPPGEQLEELAELSSRFARLAPV